MNSYTSFLKANQSLLFSLHSIKDRNLVRVKADRKSLPGLFAEHLSRSSHRPIKLVWCQGPLPKNGGQNESIWFVANDLAPEAVELNLLPLSVRPADRPRLVQHFFGKLGLSQSEMNYLNQATWPGDLLQMHAVAQAKRFDHQANLRELLALPEDDLMQRNLIRIAGMSYWTDLIGECGLKGATDLFADQLIDLQLEQTNGKVAAAAKLMKIPATTLYSRISTRRRRSAVV